MGLLTSYFRRGTRQAEALAGLVVVQEGLIALVNLALQDLASTAGARARAAGVGQLQALLLSLVQDVYVLRAFLGCSFARLLKAFFSTATTVWSRNATLHM